MRLLPACDSFAELAGACRVWCDTVNTRRHRATGQIPADRLDIERTTLHILLVEPLALDEERVVGSDRTISFNSVRCSTPARLHRRQGLVPRRRARAARSPASHRVDHASPRPALG
ncbi:hypothetical protein ACIPRD_24490 [Streptomyces sp. NPDC090108]|uniref:hypothetical protein n=1 Tax=Streptomyces sp. NPDC090108 TaxID=3365947 RepID=UPI00382D0285